MLKDMTLGQYYPVDSMVHRLDPRTKLAGTLLYIISLFITNNVVGYAIAFLFLCLCIGLSHVPPKYIIKGLKPVLVLMFISIFFNLFFIKGAPVLFSWKLITITQPGLRQAILMAVRLVFLISGSALMTYTTTPTALTDGMEKGLGFLKIFKVPVHEIAMMMSIALRFIPILAEEADKIQKAQTARGAVFDEGNVIQRAKALVPLLVPLFISAFRRATDLAMAMEARCYHGGDGRTKMHPLKYGRNDMLVYAAFLMYLALVFISRKISIEL